MAINTQQEYPASPEQEIKELEQKLEEKKRALAEQGNAMPQEKEILREVLREHIREDAPAEPVEKPSIIPQISVSHIPADDAKQKPDGQPQKEVREEKLRALVQFALRHTIRRAVEKANAESPYVLDELHDRLVDEYYEKLVALRKLTQL